MASLRPEERAAASAMTNALGLRVLQHDDGSQPGMFDLGFQDQEGRTAAVEVTAAVDPHSTELWKLVSGHDDRWSSPGLRGGWSVTLHPSCRARRLRLELPLILLDAERSGLTQLRPRRTNATAIERRARDLRVASAAQYGTDFPGSIYPSIEQPHERTGGLVDPTGQMVPIWAAQFLAARPQRDVLLKLARSKADQRHAFLLVPGFTTAPFGVVDMLSRNLDDLVPVDAPILPAPVTHLWMMTFWSVGSGLRWSSEGGWERFDRVLDGTE